MLKRNLLMVLVCALGAARSLLEGNEYALRGTGLVAPAQRRYPYVLIALPYMGVIMTLRKCKQCGKT
jgi:hypothetical protein